MRVFESLNCIVCKEPFARVANQPRSPRHLCCGLAMCNECFEQEQELNQEEGNHQCGRWDFLYREKSAYFLIDVLSQESALVFTPMGYVLLKPFKIPECPFCLDEFSNEIEAKKSACSFEICGACAYVKHHWHGATPLLEKKANQMSMELQQESRNVINTYKDLVPKLHKGLLEGINVFETKLLLKEEILNDAATFADLQEKHESFTKIKSTFESYAEDYLPCLRKFDTGVNQLIQTLNEIRDA
ncbi:unnamed protein product, partial [Mesorhabditis belari]|uniref:Uncharacterized protein n=1 Tax=Mesorhabditis belari TaxID=2138241 RepID=A0AAF3J8A2_9BILA